MRVLLLVALVALAAAGAHAQCTTSWVNPAGGAWAVAGNWDNGVPDGADDACIELAGTFGYSEVELLEKWGRDSKILDIFEGTQQIQQLIVARRLLNLSSAELK